MITTVCKISYGSQTVPPIVPAVQGDTGRAISFEIADFTPPAGATATYFILKPSGEAIYNSATITDNSILCELTAQSLAEAGENRMQVRVLQGEDIVTSFEVILMVRTFLGDDAIESGTEMNIFDQAVEQATEQFQENAEQIVEEVIESIPADYTELTEEVSELNERLGNAEDNIKLNNYYRLYDGNQTLKTYATRTLARADIPSTYKKLGLTIVYNLSNANENELVIEKFDGDGISDWSGDQFWKDLNTPSIYWGKLSQNNIHIENYVKKVISNKPLNIGIRMLWSNSTRKYSFAATTHTSDETAMKFIGRLDDISLPQTPGITVYTLTKYDSTDPEIKIVVDTYRLANESFNKSFYSYPSLNLASAYGSCAYVSVENNSEIESIKTDIEEIETKTESDRNESNIYRLYDGAQTLKTYTTRTLARTDVPSGNRKVGLVIVYKLSNSFEEEKIIVERFDGSINHWLSDQLWYDFSSTKLYWGKVPKPEIHIENYVKQVIVDSPVIVGIRFVYSLTNNNFSLLASVHNSDETAIKFVGRLDNISIPASPGITEYTLTKYDETDPIITVVVDTYRLSTENFITGFISYDSASLAGAYGSCVHSTIKKESYDIVYDAVRKGKTGTIKVGQIQMNGNSVVDVPVSYTDFVTKPVEEAYTPMLRNELFPYVRKATQKRVTIDNVDMYMCSFSPKRVYFSTTPTSQIVYEDYDDLAYSFMGYADKDNLDTVIKINLPSDMPNARYPGVHIGRRKYIMELSNGDALIEVENGLEISGDVECRNNLYLISNFTSYIPQNGEITIPSSACTRVLQFVRNSTIAKFMSSVEYAPGKIMLTPYGSNKSARVYISEDYGNTWELIFCGDVDNTENIPIKAEYLQTETAAGAWPTPYAVIPKNAVDWSKTGNNNIHVHGCAYDHYYDRIWIVTGDGGGVLNSVTGIWYTDDMGLNWHKVELGGENEPFYHYGTQFIDVIPMDNVVIFGNDGQGDGFYRWVRNGKKANVVIEPVYQFTGENTSLSVVGQTWYKARNGFVFQTFSPNHDIARGDYKIRGGVVATYNGFSFSKIYADEFTDVSGDGQLAYDTHEIGWGCRITEDAHGNILTTARQGGYLLMEY